MPRQKDAENARQHGQIDGQVKVLSPYSTLNYQGEQNYTLNGENTSIFGTDENLINEIFSGMLSEGAFPQMDTEALITENAQGMLGLNIGDQITIGTPNGNKHIFTVSGILGNASNLMRNDLYGVFVTIEAFQTLYFDGNSGEPTEYTPDHYFAQFSSTRDIQSKIAALKSQVGLSDEQVSENTKLLGLLGQSSNSLMLQVYASATPRGKEVKGKSGEHLTTIPPYGYMKDPDNKKKWIIDEEAAAVVQQIFALCVSGMGPTQIAKWLEKHEIYNPTAYSKAKGRPVTNKPTANPYKWTREIMIVYNFIGAFDFERAKEKAQNTTEKQRTA